MARRKSVSPVAAAVGRRTGKTTSNDTQMQLRLPSAIVKSMKRDAFESNQTLSNFLTACYLTAKKANSPAKHEPSPQAAQPSA
jgi:hypothetical protein